MHTTQLAAEFAAAYRRWCERRGLDPDDTFDTGAGPAMRAIRAMNAKRVAEGKRARGGAYWGSQIKRDVEAKLAKRAQVGSSALNQSS